MFKFVNYSICLALSVWVSSVVAEEAIKTNPEKIEKPSESPQKLDKDGPPQESTVPQKTLDGIYMEAVEAYPNTKPKEINLGLGLYPFNAYYQAFSVSGGFLYHFNNTHAWEVVNGHYYFTFDKGLTTELADKFRLGAIEINRLQYIATTNGVFTALKGKFVFLRNYIRYFQASLIYGGGVVKTKKTTSFAANIGSRFGIVMGDRFSWGVEVRDAITITGFTNIVTFSLVGGYSF